MFFQNNKVLVRFIFCSLFYLFESLAASAYAEDLAQKDAHLETIVVTARKMDEAVQEIPAAVTVLEGKALAQEQAQDISALQHRVPSLSIDTSAPISGSSNAAVVYQRGVGQNEFLLTNDPGVGIYQDGVYLPRSTGSVLNLLDVDRVEVLRGSNGVLWGNTIGGAINVISRKPGTKSGGEARVTAGGDNHRDEMLAFDAPLINDVLLSRITISNQYQDGYVKRLSDGDMLGDNNEQYFRGQLLWLPRDDFSAHLIFDKTHAHEHSAPMVLIGDNAALFNAQTSASSLTSLYNATTGQFLPAPSPCCGSNGVYDARYMTGSHYKTWGTGPDKSNLDSQGASLTAEWAIYPDVKFTSITGARSMQTDFGRDPDNSPLTILNTSDDITHRQFSEEMRLQGVALSRKLDWLTGLWYFDEKGRDRFEANIFPALYTSIALPLSIAGAHDAGSTIWAGYGQATWHFTPDWSASYGLRYTENTKTFSSNEYLSDVNAPLLPAGEYSNRFENVSQYASVQFQVSPDVLSYLSYSEGFKSGGYVARYIMPTTQPITFDEETVSTYELGLKTSWFDSRLISNTALFESNYNNIQLLIFHGIIPLTQNAGDARIRGVEQEVVWAFASNWKLAANAAWMDSDYLNVDAASPVKQNNLFVNTPEWAAHLDLHHTMRWQDVGEWEAVLDYSWRSETAKDSINTPQLIQDAYSVVNAFLTFRPINRAMDITLYGKNLTNESYILSGVADIPTFGAGEVAYSRPREVGASLTVRF